MDEETLKAITEFLTHVADVYDRRGCLLRGHVPIANEVGSGRTRVVVVKEFHGIRIAIKFVRNSSRNENRVEWEAWQKMPDSIRAMTARPYAISQCYRAIAFEYVPQTVYECFGDPIEHYVDTGWACHRARYSHIVDFNNRLKQLFQEAGYDSLQIQNLLRDNRADNIGVRSDGALVWIDFAKS